MRALILLRAHLASHRGGGLFPAATLLSHALVAAALTGLVRDFLPPFPYAVFALSITAALVSIPLLGELGYLLRADPAEAWVSALPARPIELRLARTAHLLCALFVLALASLLPAAALAPADLALLGRVALVLEGLGMALGLAAVLLAVQALLGGRAEPLLILAQTALVVAVVLGLVLGVRLVAGLSEVTGFADAPGLALLPPAWFAAPQAAGGSAWFTLLPVALALAAAALLLVLPAPAPKVPSARPSWSELLLLPARRLGTRLWLRADERGPFDLVYDALPREREVVLRTVPMIGIPLAFLVAGTLGDVDAQKTRGLLALLLFTPGVYLPVLLTQVPVSASWRARWLLDASPVPPGALAAGATKALALRFLLPLYVVLFGLAWSQGGLSLAISLALPGAAVSLIALRRLYAICVTEPPLSSPPDEVHVEFDWGGSLFGLAVLLTVLAAAASRYLDGIGLGLGVAAALFALELWGERRLRARLG